MNKTKWKTLQHNGPLFPKKYEYKKIPVLVSGKEFVLDEQAEEMAYAWAAKSETEYIKDEVFQKNFWNDFKSHLPKTLQNSSFPKDWDFSKMYSYILNVREEKKQVPKAQKDKEKEERDKLKAIYGVATLDGQIVDLGAYIVEPAGIYIGRGKNPHTGKWKSQVQPEDVVINISKNATVPTPPKGHHWKEVVENKGAFWVCMWRNKIDGSQKRVMFGATSFVKQNADKKKFSKAIILAKNWEKVMDHIDKGLVSRDLYTRKVATVSKIISTMSIRVGDEKGEDETDTKGATTLTCENLKVSSNTIEFNFLGKDSVPYHNIVEFDINTIRNIKEFMNGKKNHDMIFDGVTSSEVTEFLSSAVPGLTAKIFRTATGSNLLAKELRKKQLDPSMKESKKVEYYTNCNLEIAIKLNHQSAVSEAYDNSIVGMKNTLESLKAEQIEINKNLNSLLEEAKKERDEKISIAKSFSNKERSKNAIERANKNYESTVEKLNKKISKTQEKIDSISDKIRMKEKTRGISLSTSKLNYSDPRLAISWCKDNDVDIKRIYPITAQKKFGWALDVDEDFYKNYPEVEDE